MTTETPQPAPTTVDAFLGGQVLVEQPAKGYRAGLDAVLLAATVSRGKSGSPNILDVGAGVGTAGLCAAARLSSAKVVLFEREPGLADLARANVVRNGVAARVSVVEGDVLGKAAQHEALGLRAASFDTVICNPPYLAAGRSSLPADVVAAGAFGMPPEDLERWMQFLARMAAPGGEMTMIHRADALADILSAIGARFGAVVIRPLHPRSGAPAHRVIVSGIKGSRAPLQLLSGLVLHGEGNAFVPPVSGILRQGDPLPLRPP